MGELFGRLNDLAQAHPLAFWAGYAVLLLFVAYWVRVTVLAWEGLRHAALNLFYVLAALYLVGLGAVLILRTAHATTATPAIFALGFVFFAAGSFALQKERPRRKRTIPKRIRNAVIKRDLGSARFDSSKHHIDHVWPFARWGSHSTKNLRVISKKRNLQKGAKYPHWWEVW